MPTLPTLTITQPQLDACVAAFGDAAGYKSWLKAAVRDEVMRRKVRELDESANTAKHTALVSFEATLPPADPPAAP